MASNRLTSDASSATDQVEPETPTDALMAVARHTARIQIAALSTAGNTLASWARAADRLAQAVGIELLRRVDGECDSRESIVRVAAATDAHLRELTELPRAAVSHFDARLGRASVDNQEVLR